MAPGSSGFAAGFSNLDKMPMEAGILGNLVFLLKTVGAGRPCKTVPTQECSASPHLPPTVAIVVMTVSHEKSPPQYHKGPNYNNPRSLLLDKLCPHGPPFK